MRGFAKILFNVQPTHCQRHLHATFEVPPTAFRLLRLGLQLVISSKAHTIVFALSAFQLDFWTTEQNEILRSEKRLVS